MSRNSINKKRGHPNFPERPFEVGNPFRTDDNDRQSVGIGHAAPQKLQAIGRRRRRVQQHNSARNAVATHFDVFQTPAGDHADLVPRELPLKLGSPAWLLLEDDRRRRGRWREGRKIRGHRSLTFVV